MSNMALAYAMKKRAKKMAKGGEVESKDKIKYTNPNPDKSPYSPIVKGYNRHGDLYENRADQMRYHERTGENFGHYAKGGEVDGDDMIGDIMRRRSGSDEPVAVNGKYSEGGMVANDTPDIADFKENDFDDLALRDDLESPNTGANSGDELGNERLDMDDRDMVSRIMRSRAKKDRLPRPA